MDLGLGLGGQTDDLQMIAFAIGQVAIFGTAALAYWQSRQNAKVAKANHDALERNTTETLNIKTLVNGRVDALTAELVHTKAALAALTTQDARPPPPPPPASDKAAA